MISQLTVFIENEEGRLARMCRVVSDAGIDMHALFLADTETFGVARIFCDTPNAACNALRTAGYRASITPVIAVRVPNKPGGLADLLDFLNGHAFNIEYGYCLPASDEYAIDVLKIDDQSAETALKNAGYESANPEDIYAVD
jgi:hypothetical protein